MGDKPSYLTSTTSLVFIIVAVGFVGVALLMAGIGAWRDQPQLISGAQGALESLLTFIGLLYGVRKGGEMVRNGSQPTTTGGTP